MADSTVRGRFVWHELMTTDVASAVTFYKKVVGWKTQAWEQDSSYLMWVAKSGPVGGVAGLKSDANAQPSWLAYVGVTDIDATVNDVGRLGGTVMVPATAIPNGGKYAVVADPQGATFGIYAAANATPMPGKPGIGDFAWHELATSDYQAAFRFYQALFGWETVGEHDMVAMGVYYMFGVNGQPCGGMYNKGIDTRSHWLSYACVADAKQAAKTAGKAGGKVVHGPSQVPGGSWITQIVDPQGALNAVVSSPEAESAPTSKKKAVKKPAKKRSATKAKPPAAVKKSAKKAAKKVTKKKAAKKKAAKKKVIARKPAATKKKATKKKPLAKPAKRAGKKPVAKKKSAAKRKK